MLYIYMQNNFSKKTKIICYSILLVLLIGILILLILLLTKKQTSNTIKLDTVTKCENYLKQNAVCSTSADWHDFSLLPNTDPQLLDFMNKNVNEQAMFNAHIYMLYTMVEHDLTSDTIKPSFYIEFEKNQTNHLHFYCDVINNDLNVEHIFKYAITILKFNDPVDTGDIIFNITKVQEMYTYNDGVFSSYHMASETISGNIIKCYDESSIMGYHAINCTISNTSSYPTYLSEYDFATCKFSTSA